MDWTTDDLYPFSVAFLDDWTGRAGSSSQSHNDRKEAWFSQKWAWPPKFCARFARNSVIEPPLQEILHPPL